MNKLRLDNELQRLAATLSVLNKTYQLADGVLTVYDSAGNVQSTWSMGQLEAGEVEP